MDFWELTKLVIRRWYIALPLVVLTVVGALWTASAVKPQYKAVGHVQLIPPQVYPDTVGKTGGARNPWADLGPEALGQAVIVGINQPDTEQLLETQEMAPTFLLAIDDYFPMINVEVVGETPEQATKTVRYLYTLIEQGFKAQQSVYKVPPAQAITTHQLDTGLSVTAETGNIKRALVAVLGAGLLLTAAITIAVDALIRIRRRRRFGGEPGLGTREPIIRTPDPVAGRGRALPTPAFSRPALPFISPALPSAPGLPSGPGSAGTALSTEATVRVPTSYGTNGGTTERTNGIAIAYEAGSRSSYGSQGSSRVYPADGQGSTPVDYPGSTSVGPTSPAPVWPGTEPPGTKPPATYEALPETPVRPDPWEADVHVDVDPNGLDQRDSTIVLPLSVNPRSTPGGEDRRR